MARFALLGLSGHALYSAVFGAMVGFARLRRGLGSRIGLCVAGFFIASLSHLAWDTIGVLGNAVISGTVVGSTAAPGALQEGPVPAWALWLANVGTTFAACIPAVVAVIVALRKSGRWETRAMREQLGNEVGSAAVMQAEYEAIADGAPMPAAGLARRIYQAQCRLAKSKARLTLRGKPMDGDADLERLRARLALLRGQGREDH